MIYSSISWELCRLLTSIWVFTPIYAIFFFIGLVKWNSNLVNTCFIYIYFLKKPKGNLMEKWSVALSNCQIIAFENLDTKALTAKNLSIKKCGGSFILDSVYRSLLKGRSIKVAWSMNLLNFYMLWVHSLLVDFSWDQRVTI